MKSLDWIKTLKITAGCTIGYLLAKAWGLNFATSVITITLLSIQSTRRDTFITAGKRFLAFFNASLLCFLLFPATGYSVVSLTLYLLFFFTLCQLERCTEGASMSTVLMLHIWSAKEFTAASFLNEFFLMTIGILTAFFMNLYMPDKVKQIRAYQRSIEELMKSILNQLSLELKRLPPKQSSKDQLEELGQILNDSLQNALYTEKNYVFKDMSYYVSYIRMRARQYDILGRIRHNLPRLHDPCYQTILVSHFMEDISSSIYEYNNSKDLIAHLAALRKKFRQAPLPADREEFETRAVLYEIVSELEALLCLKREFAQQLTDYQIRTFWKL